LDGSRGISQPGQEQLGCHAPGLVQGLVDGGQSDMFSHIDIIESDNGQFFWHFETMFAGRPQ
jgi:hypothetical protein